MSNIFKNWKDLYKKELKNRELLMKQNSEYSKRSVEQQKTIKDLKYRLTKARIDLEDTKGFLKQEKEVSYALRQERNKLLTKNKQLKAEIKELKGGENDEQQND